MIQDRDTKPASTQMKEEEEVDEFITFKLPKIWAKEYLADMLARYFERSLDDARLYHDSELNKEFIARSTLKAFGVSKQRFIYVIMIDWVFNYFYGR